MQLRNSLIHLGSETFSAYSNVEDNKEDEYDSGVNDFGDDIPHDMYMDEDVPLHQEQVQQPVLMYQLQNSYETLFFFLLLEIGFIFCYPFPA